MDRDRMAMVKIRRPEGSKPKYAEAYRDRPILYPAPLVVRIGKPLVVCAGELAARRWGSARGDPTSGIIIDKPNRAQQRI